MASILRNKDVRGGLVTGMFQDLRHSMRVLLSKPGLTLVALLLASIGVYGVLSYPVSQRTQEVSIRMALGARRLQVLRMVVRQGMASVLAGVALGLASAVGLARLLSTQIFGVTTTDPVTFAGVAATVLLVAMLASILPAVRMTRVDSATVLRRG